MARCPNCARETLRTKDWVCQWCGYPLLTGFYRRIDKTYKEIRAEREQARKDTGPEEGSPLEPESPPPKPEPKIEVKQRPESRPKAGPAMEPEPIPRTRPVAEPQSEPGLEPPVEDVRPPAPLPVPPPEKAPEPPSAMSPPPAPEPPEIPPLKLEEIVDGVQITVDQLDLLYRANKTAAHSRLTGKTISVRGVVGKVFIRDHLDVRYVVLNGQVKTAAWSARCSFDRDNAPEFGRLQEGEAALVQGKYDGFSKHVLLKECRLIG